MYAKIENGSVAQYPLDEAQVRSMVGNVSLPEDLQNNLPDGFVYVAATSRPADTEYATAVGPTAKLVNGVWAEHWDMQDKFTPQELADYQAAKNAAKTRNIRDLRNQAIEDTDFLVLRHTEEKLLNMQTTLSEPEYLAWVTYRQQLRDYMASVTDPWNAPPMPAAPGNL